MTPTRSFSSLLGVLTGFLVVFPWLVKREKQAPVLTSEVLLAQAQQQLREAQERNRERAVQAITQKNNLQALVDQTQRMVDRLTERAEAAESPDDRWDLLTERDKYTETLAGVQKSLEGAIVTTEAVKTAMRREEERIRAMTAEAMALQAQEKQIQFEMAIARNTLAMTSNLMADLFEQVREKVRHSAAQRDIMMQIVQTVDTLTAAEAEARNAGNDILAEKLSASREALKASALNASLWKSSYDVK